MEINEPARSNSHEIKMNEIKIKLPEYAIRYLIEMCGRERDRINYDIYRNQIGVTLQHKVALDSISAIEAALL